MGGPIAQLLWHRHPDRVAGLVMVATSHRFVPGMRERMIFTSTMAVAAGTTRAGQVVSTLPRSWAQQTRRFMAVRQPVRPDSMRHWAAAEMRRHDIRLVLEAGGAIGRYDARRWIGEVDVPARGRGHHAGPGRPARRTGADCVRDPGGDRPPVRGRARRVRGRRPGHAAGSAACREVAERAGLGRLA